jgi:hypothetical protein
MITGAAVLFGSAEAPCAASFEAAPVTIPGADLAPERAVLLLDDLEHAWIVRQVSDPGLERTGIEYRTMSCKFDPNLDVPEEISGAPEALAPRR